MHAHSHGDLHERVPPRVVLTAAALTVTAAAAEVLGSWWSGSLFLTADALHLTSHLGIFAVLLLPTTRSHEQRNEELPVNGRWARRCSQIEPTMVHCARPLILQIGSER